MDTINMEMDNNNHILNNETNNLNELTDIDDISNKLHKTSTKNSKFNKKNKYYDQYSRIVEEEKCKWFYVVLENGNEDIIQSDSKRELLEDYKNIKKIKFSKMEPTWYKLEKKLYNEYNKFVWKSYDFVEDNIPYYLYTWNKVKEHNLKITNNWKNEKVKPNHKRGVIYARTSVNVTELKSLSIYNQVDALFEYCLQNNMFVDFLIEDDGVSGWFNKNKKSMNNFGKNSELYNTIELLKDNHILLLYRVDRLGRYQPETQRLLDTLDSRGVNVYFYDEKITWCKNMKPESRHFIKSKVMEAHISSEEKSRIAKQTYKRRKEKGILSTNTPYGYRLSGGIRKPIQSEQKNLKSIIKLYKQNIGFKNIAKHLNNIPSKTRLGKDFTSSYVKSLFKRYKHDKEYFKSKDFYIPKPKIHNLNNNNILNNNSNNSINNSNNSVNNCYYNSNNNTINSSNNIIINNKIYKKINVPGDGHCFYRSVAYQLKNKLNLNYTISHLRILASNYMENHKTLFINSYNMNQHNGLTYNEYVRQIKNTNIWAENDSIVALQKALKIKIHIYTNGVCGLSQIVNGSTCEDNFESNIKVFYNGIDHYDALKREKNN